VPLRFDLRGEIRQLTQIAGKRFRFDAEIRKDRAREDRAADRSQRVLRPRQNRRRRFSADPLQRHQHLRDDIAALIERLPNALLLGMQGVEARFDAADVILGGAKPSAGGDQIGAEARLILLESFDLLAKRRLAAF
jgi:hypothetical protein